MVSPLSEGGTVKVLQCCVNEPVGAKCTEVEKPFGARFKGNQGTHVRFKFSQLCGATGRSFSITELAFFTLFKGEFAF